jgi:acetolactate synthase I/II/III large subunit
MVKGSDLLVAALEKPPFIRGSKAPQVIHVSYAPANRREALFPAMQCRG